MKIDIKRLLIPVFFVLLPSNAYSDCWLGGEVYSTGEEVNEKVCQVDGSWR